MNIYYDYDKLGWEMTELRRDDLDYAFDLLCFWRSKEGLVYSASDSG